MPGKQRLLFSHIYFPPSPKPYGKMLEFMAIAFAEKGYEVSVFTSLDPAKPQAAEEVDRRLGALGISVSRVAMKPGQGLSGKLRSAVRYTIALSRHIMKARPDIATVGSFPPLMTAFSAALAGRLAGTRILYHVQDIHPDITAPKLPSALRPFYRMGGGLLARLTLRLVHGVVTLSDDMRKILVARGAPEGRTVAINNLSLSSLEPTSGAPAAAMRADGRLKVIYAGNMGAFQALDVVAPFVVKAVSAIPNIEFVFVGDGVRREWLMNELAGLDPGRVRFLDAMPFAELQPLLAQADLGLVSLDDASARFAYPSKIVTYLGMGLPLLCLIARESSIAREIEENGLGIAFDAKGIEDAVSRLAELSHTPADVAGLKRRAGDYFASSFSAETYVRRWSEFLKTF